MSINNYDLGRDVINTEVITRTNFEITSATAASERSLNSFVMEATSTGFLVNAKGTTTSTPLSAAFRNISNYFFSSSASNRIPVAQNNVATTGISRVITIGRTTTDDSILSGSVTGTFSFGTQANKVIIDLPEQSISGAVGRRGDLVEKADTTNIVGTIFYDTGTMIFHGGDSSRDTNFLIDSTSGFVFGPGATAGNVAINNISFVSLNMLKRSVFFTRAFNQEFNYSNNPTAIANASLGSISSNLTGMPTSFITTIGLYNNDNELVAVAKTSPPVKKDFDTEKVFAVRLQY
tara:strand:+ start:398 stop:1273 length:876 start_codon:yes stop_codon:yes gene_type:complete